MGVEVEKKTKSSANQCLLTMPFLLSPPSLSSSIEQSKTHRCAAVTFLSPRATARPAAALIRRSTKASSPAPMSAGVAAATFPTSSSASMTRRMREARAEGRGFMVGRG